MRDHLFLICAWLLISDVAAYSDTIAYWRFEEGADGFGAPGLMPETMGHVVSQYNSPFLNGTSSTGATQYVADVPEAIIDGIGANNLALYFDGDDAWMVLHNSLLDFGPPGSAGDFTIEMFLRVNPVPNNGRSYRLVQKQGAHERHFARWL